jgi:NADH-quinone oxidoreductase subunit G
LSKKLKIAAIGSHNDLTYSYSHLGDDVEVLKDLLEGKLEFCEILQKATKPMLILGHDMLAREDGDLILTYSKKIAEKFNLIQDGWNGFNFLAKSTGLINGLELGFVGASNVSEILQKAENSEIKMVILHSVDDDLDFEKLKNAFVVYIGSHGDKGASIADVILPAAAYSEKEAIFINLEGRPQSTTRATFAPGQAKEDWKIILELARKLGLDLGFKNLPELRKAMQLASNLEKISEASWMKSVEIKGDFSDKKLSPKEFDFYLTNPIARASRTLNKCSVELV